MPHFYPFGITITYEGKVYTGRVGIVGSYYYSDAVVPEEFSIILNYKSIGRIRYTDEGWKGGDPGTPQGLVDLIGEYIMLWYE